MDNCLKAFSAILFRSITTPSPSVTTAFRSSYLVKFTIL